MNIIRAAKELAPSHTTVCLAIGFFDGVHLGHQRILAQTVADAAQHGALPLAVTFDRHPNAVVAPHRVPPLIQPLPHKLRTLAAHGTETILLLHFDKPFSEQSGELFIRNLARDLGPIATICVGANFTFGHKRSGTVQLLRSLGTHLGFSVHGLDSVSLDGKPISSTRIREAIRSGDLALASRMLGRPYSLASIVVQGDRLGHKIGFPTANLNATELTLPPDGVYSAQAILQGKTYRAVVNVGCRPTLREPKPQRRVEAHLLGINADFYGADLELVFGRKLRDEKKFASLEELKQQIALDVELAQAATAPTMP